MSQTISREKPAKQDQINKVDQYLLHQLSKTGSQVRMIDLFTAFMALFAGILGGLFVLAIIDAWIFELGTVARWVCLIALLAGSAYYVARVIIPLTIRKINPAYAARVIESSQPSMHNGLVNYVYLRSRRDKAHGAVVNAVGNRAATDISGVVVENTVDKSHTLRAAIILTVLVVLFGLYKVLSPKDPFQTFARVLVPTSDIAKPARVTVSDVEPGDADVYFGQPLKVTARVSGSHNPNQIHLVYTTDDGQLVDARVAMQPSSVKGVYEGVLKTGISGIEQSLQYRVIAGDGYSNVYRVTLKSTPTLSVSAIEYDPPAYTKLPARVVNGSSEIEALEGTRVKINAQANTPIRSAYIELLNQIESGEYRVLSTVSMGTEKNNASCQFALHLDQSRSNRQYTHYRLRFTTDDGQKSEPVAVYPIRITPDLAPQLTVMQPVEREIELPLNGSLRFAAQASDPDFEIDRIEIRGLQLGATLFQEQMPLGNQNRAMNVKTSFDFRPIQYSLREGDRVIINIAAFDNRHAANDLPDPNVTRSDNFTVKIIQADDSLPETGDSDQASQPDAAQDSEEQSDEGQQESGEQGDLEDAGSSDSGQTDPENSQTGTGDSEEGSESSEQSADSSGEQRDQRSGEQADEQNQTENAGDQQSGSNEQSDQASDQQSGNAQSDSSESATDESNTSGQTGGSGDSQDQSTSSDANSQTGDGRSSDATGEAQSDSETSSGASNPASDDPNMQSNSQGGDPTGEVSDYSLGEDPHDGEIIERVLQYQEQQEQSEPQNDQSGDPNESQPSEGAADSADNNEDASNNRQPDEQSGDQGESSASDSSEQSAQESSQTGDPQSDGTQSGNQQADNTESGDEQQNERGDSQGQSEEQASENNNAAQQSGGNQDPSQSASQEERASDDAQSQSTENQQRDDSGQSGSEGNQSSDRSGDSQSANQDQSETSGNQSEQSTGEAGSQSQEGQPQRSDSQQGTENQGADSASDQDGQSGDQEGQQTGSRESSESAESSSSGSSQGDQQGQESGDAASGNQSSTQQGEGQSEGSQSNSSGNQSGAGQAGSNSQGTGEAAQPPGYEPTEKDQANLEYSKKATDLALDYLEKQQIDPDPKLLDELNWSEEDLRDFIKRWRELQNQADTGTEAQRKEYEESLKSLGLRTPDTRRERSDVVTDDDRGYQQDARVSKPPADLADKFRAFQKSRNRAGNRQ